MYALQQMNNDTFVFKSCYFVPSGKIVLYDQDDKYDFDSNGNLIEQNKPIKDGLNLKLIALKTHNSRYNPSIISILYLHLKDLNVTANITQQGKITINGFGSTDKESAIKHLKLVEKIIVKVYNLNDNNVSFYSELQDVKVNVMCTYETKTHAINLNEFQFRNEDFVTYDIEKHPNLIYRPPPNNNYDIKKIIMTVRGKIIIYGSNSDKIKEYVENDLNNLLKKSYEKQKIFEKKPLLTTKQRSQKTKENIARIKKEKQKELEKVKRKQEKEKEEKEAKDSSNMKKRKK